MKKNRPLASGAVHKMEAVCLLSILLVVALGMGIVLLPRLFIAVLMGYLLMNVVYTYALKHIPIIDIVCIAVGFVLRIFAGGTATQIYISPWIVMMTFLLALFLALAKRKDDLILADQGHRVRKAIDGYNLEFISLAMAVMASVIIVSYILYTVSPEIVAKHGTPNLYVTGLWVILGLLRFLQITFVQKKRLADHGADKGLRHASHYCAVVGEYLHFIVSLSLIRPYYNRLKFMIGAGIPR